MTAGSKSPPRSKAVLRSGDAVVALESTLITHGLPYPANADTALAAEDAVRTSGAVPATIAILHGRVRVGLSSDEIHGLARGQIGREGFPPRYSGRARQGPIGRHDGCRDDVSRRQGGHRRLRDRAASAAFIAERKRRSTFPPTSNELGSTAIAVVAAGAKSILDIPKTLEVLETLGVPVIGYGSDEFPAFFARASGSQGRAPLRPRGGHRPGDRQPPRARPALRYPHRQPDPRNRRAGAGGHRRPHRSSGRRSAVARASRARN